MELLVYTIGGQKIGIDIGVWDDAMLSGNTAFMVIADGGTIPTDYVDISSTVYWDKFGGMTTLNAAEIKDEITKLLSGTPTPEEAQILAYYSIDGIDNITKVGDTPILGTVATGSTVLTGVTDAAVYGSQHHLAVDITETETSSNTPVVKVSLTTSDLPQGKYKIEAAWIGRHSSTNSDMLFDTTLNDTPIGTVSTLKLEVKDNTSTYSVDRVYYLDLSGVNTIALRYWNETNTTYISDATIELFRIK